MVECGRGCVVGLDGVVGLDMELVGLDLAFARIAALASSSPAEVGHGRAMPLLLLPPPVVLVGDAFGAEAVVLRARV